ncbi:MAG: GcrA cell cycle regulator [Alphaproteobacteria bacterium]|nr:GcrA cell cycle regulator [Alphaproteobacteria bacterium]
MEWSDEMIARLRGLWDEGHSTAEIGRRMGVSKNAIIGKAHRLALPGRPSPIRPEREPGANPRRRRSAPRRMSGPTLPALAALQTPLPAALVAPAAAPAGERRPPAPRPTYAAFARIGGRQLPCCWPIGEPGTPSFRFCDDVALPGKPYCDTHAQLAYVRVRDRRDDAA